MLNFTRDTSFSVLTIRSKTNRPDDSIMLPKRTLSVRSDPFVLDRTIRIRNLLPFSPTGIAAETNEYRKRHRIVEAKSQSKAIPSLSLFPNCSPIPCSVPMETQPAREPVRYRNFWGNSPETEEDYYALHRVSGSSGHFTAPSGRSLFTRSWAPLASPPRALVFMIHGYGNDTGWTMQATAIFLASHGFACFAADLPGHGRSPGLRAFVPDLNLALADLKAFFESVRSRPENRNLKSFLFGESMGGALCLLMHLSMPADAWAGAVLVAPMCKISDRIKPPWLVEMVLTFVARFAPTLAVVPTADLVEKSVKVPEKRVIATCNPMRYNGKPRLGTVIELLRVTNELGSRLHEVSIPFLVLHGSADEVTDPAVSKALYEEARSEDKTIKIYDGMLHSLLFGEPDENVAIVRQDILAWLNERCPDQHEVQIKLELS